MSDSEDSTITYTVVSSPFGGLLDTRSPGVDRPPVMPKDPYAYVVAAFQAPPSPDYVSGPEYPPSPEFIPEPAYLDYVLESDPEEDPKEDNDEDPEEDPVDYPDDGGDDGDDEDESSDDDEDDDDVDIEEDKEEEEHLAPVNSTAVVFSAVDHASYAKETEPFEIDKSAATPPPHPAYRVTAKISIRPQTPVSLPSDTEVARLLAIPTPPPSPLSPWSSPLLQIPSPPLLPTLLPTSSPPLHLLSTDSSADRLKDEMLVDIPGTPATDDTELGRRMTEFTTLVRQDTEEMYTRLDEQTERQLVMSLRTTVLGQQAVITELQGADRRRQASITKLLAADHRRQAQFIEALKLLKAL
ncbi:hypothetical protein Tco_0664517 [Tanacetum coccineum]